MANAEHLEMLKQGVDVWNRWREENAEIIPDMNNADLSGLGEANLRGADLRFVNLGYTYLIDVDLSWTNLEGADFTGAELSRVHLKGVNLRGAGLRGANLRGADLSGADLSGAKTFSTVFGDMDLRGVKGLEAIVHEGPSIIGIDTLEPSQGGIPEAFLRGAGVSEHFIAYARSLVTHPMQYFTCFISYSHKDEEFIERLYTDLQNNGIRCWLDQEDLKIGDRWRDKIEEAIRFYDKLLLVLSETSVNSEWVEREVEAAFEKERKKQSLVLFPIRLDEAVMDNPRAWAGDIRRMRHIGDFRGWKDHHSYQRALNRLLRDLKS